MKCNGKNKRVLQMRDIKKQLVEVGHVELYTPYGMWAQLLVLDMIKTFQRIDVTIVKKQPRYVKIFLSLRRQRQTEREPDGEGRSEENTSAGDGENATVQRGSGEGDSRILDVEAGESN